MMVRFIVDAETDVGIKKKINQDSLLYQHAVIFDKEVLMAIVCDGMGGLSKGELASASLIRAFLKWFHEELPNELKNFDMQIIKDAWVLKLKEWNLKLNSYGKTNGITLGTTFSGMLFVDDQMLAVHIGDSRIYFINHTLQQLTKDHTFVEREVERGTMTLADAKKDRRRNILLQCIGASGKIEPQVVQAPLSHGIYMLCSDGLRHELSDAEIMDGLQPSQLKNKTVMKQASLRLINLVKSRGEKDNISMILIKAGDK